MDHGPSRASSPRSAFTDVLRATRALLAAVFPFACFDPGDATPSSAETPCSAPERPTVEGERITLVPDSGNILCGGSMRHMDTFVARLMERFRIDPSTLDRSICYVWKDTLEEVAELCDKTELLRGCAIDHTTISGFAPHNHELVHNVASQLGDPPAFFREGIAVAHQGYDGLLNKEHLLNKQDPQDFMEMSTSELGSVGDFGNLVGYDVAGRFTGYLMTVYGMDAYLRLYGSLTSDADLTRIDEAFRETLGVTLADSVADYLNTWTDCWSDPLLSECNAPEIAWDGQSLAYEEVVDCDDSEVLGPYEYEPLLHRAVVERTITVTEDAMYELRLAGDTQDSSPHADVSPFINFPVHGVSLYGCGPCGDGYMETVEGGTPRLKRLKPGKYSLRLHVFRFEPGPVAFTLKKMP
jgi:hypothetical protein